MHKLFKRGTWFESVVYELNPYIYLSLAFYGLTEGTGEPVGRIASFCLILCAFVILYLRSSFRAAAVERVERRHW